MLIINDVSHNTAETGRFATTTRGGTLTVTNGYNLRGWLTSIESTPFREYLYYEQPHNGSTAQYGGNISSMDWKTGDNILRGYTFQYDGMSRLTGAAYSENGSASTHYGTSYQYDLMGNITGLTRNGLQDDNSYGQIDNLSCQYDGNRLTRITDAAVSLTYQGAFDFSDQSNATTEFLYDENGNMTQDLNKGIESIQYNLLNLPQKINFERGKSTMDIQHLYDARGRKLQAIESLYRMNIHPHFLPDVGGRDLVPSVSFRPFLSYLSKIDYCGNFIHDNNHIKVLFDGGYVTMSDNTPVYHYYLQDHLGNNRVVVKQDGTVEQVNHYYPYGGVMGESTSGDVQRYKYNGKELNRMHGLDWYDYGARHYDAAIGSWPTMDPLAEKYYSISPYAYCGDNPIKFVDLQGKEIWIYYIDNNGQLQSFQYNVGMQCDVNNSVAQTIVSNLNTMYMNESGSQVMDAIIKSSTKYGYMQSETHSEHGEGYYNSATNTICVSDVNNTLTFAEETFHVYQYVNNQGGKTAVNEVEARLFSAKMNYEIDAWYNTAFYQKKLEGFAESPYTDCMLDLFLYGYSDEKYKTAVNNFFNGALNGYIYKNKLGYTIGIIKPNPLIKRFLPAN